MEFRMTIAMDNAAFQDGNAPAELARILRSVADEITRCEAWPRLGYAADVNGNRCCTFRTVGA